MDVEKVRWTLIERAERPRKYEGCCQKFATITYACRLLSISGFRTTILNFLFWVQCEYREMFSWISRLENMGVSVENLQLYHLNLPSYKYIFRVLSHHFKFPVFGCIAKYKKCSVKFLDLDNRGVAVGNVAILCASHDLSIQCFEPPSWISDCCMHCTILRI